MRLKHLTWLRLQIYASVSGPKLFEEKRMKQTEKKLDWCQLKFEFK